MKRRRRLEQATQRTVLQHLYIRSTPNVFWFHVGNGGWRSPIEAAIFKSLGVRPGVPDLILVRNGKTYGLELKTATGRLTAAQLDCHEQLRAAGAEVGVAHSLDAALEWLERHELLRGRVS
jgi:VRR-NUC domain